MIRAGSRLALFLKGPGAKPLLFVSLFLRLMFTPATAFAEVPPAGQIISSRSVATYELNSSQLQALSNEVTLSVLPVYAPQLVPDGTVTGPAMTVRAFSGETAVFPFSLTNTGNADDSFDLAVVMMDPSDFVPTAAVVYLDADGDSLVDPGEQVVTRAGPIPPGSSVALLLAADLPGGLSGGETAHVDLTARSVSDASAFDSGNVVRIVARDEARVTLALGSDVIRVLPGEEIAYTLRFTNTGERTATGIVVSDFIDYSGLCTGTEYVTGSVTSSPPGRIEYFDIDAFQWVEVAPAPDRVRGIRIHHESLVPGAQGSLGFRVSVQSGRPAGEILNTGAASYTGGDAQIYNLSSNEIAVTVGRVSSVALGPAGNPTAETGGPDDCVVLNLNGSDTTYTFWHEVRSGGNFTDTLTVALADSSLIAPDWGVRFIDSVGAALRHGSPFTAHLGALESGGSRRVGLRLTSTPEGFRRFAGRELTFEAEAASLINAGSRDRVRDVFVKTGLPLIAVRQSVREPTALVGDILSYIVTVENLTEETAIDSVLLVEHLSPGLGYAAGSDGPSITGNILRWDVGALEPGEKREIVFRARVKAGQEMGRLVSSAFVFGVTDLGERISDGPATAAVQIVEGIFTRRGIIFGSVFIDGDGDGRRDDTERGVRNVSVFIEDGTYAVTDSSGLYSIPGVAEGTHVVRIDPASFPDSLIPGRARYFGYGVAGELLVDLAPSGNRRADFPLTFPDMETGDDALAAIGGTPPAVTPLPGDSGDSAAGPARVPAAAGVSGEAGDGPGGPGNGAAEGILQRRPGPVVEEEDTVGGPYRAITIPGSFFVSGSAVLEEIPLNEIAALGLWLREHPGWRVSIAGHTDSIPISTVEYPSNFELSLARARTVFQLFLMNGVPEKLMDYTGYGPRLPVASNASTGGRERNRRVGIDVVPPDDYTGSDPDLAGIVSSGGNTGTFSLAGDSGICAEIVTPAEGHVFYVRDGIDVEVIAPLGSNVELYVNNVPVGIEKIGQKQIDVANGTIGFIFYAVNIQPGENEILVVCKEHGGHRHSCVRHVFLSGYPEGILAERDEVTVPADGKTSPEVVFLLRDEAGLPVRDGIFVTVEGPADLLGGIDVNPHQAGIQAATRGGRVTLMLPPQRDPRIERVRVSFDDRKSGCIVSYESPLRDWFIFGYGEGSVGYSSLTGAGSTHRSQERHHDGLFAEGKLAFYGQGEVRNGHVLTAAVDTRPLREDRLFRRIEPEKYYPVYGDAGELKFNAASRSGTYVRLDHRRYNAMLGDFRTDLGAMEFTKYHRSFNGLSGEVRHGRGTVKTFVTHTDQVTYQEEFPADGTSGFYFLNRIPLVENSEKIRIEVRDRYRPEKILRVDYKQVNRDYDINYMDGSLLFKEPVPATDRNLNPVMIIVSYECRNAGENNFIYGIRSLFLAGDSLSIGTTAILEEEGVENSSLLGMDVSGQVVAGVKLESEYAHSEKFLLGRGDAFRVKLRGSHGGRFTWNTYYREIDHNFFNPSFSGGKTELGSRKYGAGADWKIARAFALNSLAYRHTFRERDEKKDYIGLLGVYSAGPLGGRFGLANAAHRDERDGDHASTLMLAGFGYQRGKTKAEIEWDQMLAGEEVQEYPNRIQAALSRRLWKSVGASLKHEYRTGSRTGTRHLTQLGLESHVTENLHLFSRYRLEGAMSGERGQASIGLKNRFRLSEDLTATFSAEKLATVSGEARDDFLALAAGALYTPKDKDYKLKGDYEIRIESERVKHLAGIGAIRKLGPRWSALFKGDLWYSDEEVENDRVKGSSTLGVSLRPRSSRSLTLLSLLRGAYEKNSPAHPGAVDRELVASFEANCEPGPKWELEGKIAARWVTNTFRVYTASSSSFLYQAHVIRVIGRRWDVGVTGRIVHQRETGTVRYGGGVELGRLMAENMWLGVGYDFGGHDDDSASVNDFSRNGIHMKIRLKFNEKLLKYFY